MEEAPTTGRVERARRRASLLGELLDLARRTVRDSIRDRLPGLAAEVAFFTLLSLPPLSLMVLGALGYVGDVFGADAVAAIQREIIEAARTILAPSTVRDVIEPAIANLLERGRLDVLSLGAVVALWSASRAVRVTLGAVGRAYDVENGRSWVQRATLALGLTAAGVVTIVVILPLLVVGPRFGSELAAEFGLARAFDVAWTIAYWPVVVALGLTLLTWVYHLMPTWNTPWLRDLPGAVLAFVTWVLGSFALRFYAVTVIETDSAYSLFAAPLVLLLWMYVSAAAFLVGAELNAEVEKKWPTPGSPFYVEPETVLGSGEVEEGEAGETVLEAAVVEVAAPEEAEPPDRGPSDTGSADGDDAGDENDPGPSSTTRSEDHN